MPGTATIGSNLVDSLLEMVDDLRGSLHADMGVRHWRVFRVVRSWDGGRRGEGARTVAELEITPQPLVTYDLRNEVTAQGVDEGGYVHLTEVSLTYTEAELYPRVAPHQELLYCLREAHGQATADRLFTVASPPAPDRVDTIGWVLKLARADVEDC